MALAGDTACLYLPFAWLLVIDHPWNGYHFFWLRLWPILPGFLPGLYAFRHHDAAAFTAMGVTSLVALVALVWLGSPGGRRLIVALGLALLTSVPTSVYAFAVYRA